jgi:hypothetical protein
MEQVMQPIILYIGITLKQATRSCGLNDPNRKTFRFDKLANRNKTHTVGLSNLKAWDNPPMAPPQF